MDKRSPAERLPNELWCQIMDMVDNKFTLCSLAQTSRHMYDLVVFRHYTFADVYGPTGLHSPFELLQDEQETDRERIDYLWNRLGQSDEMGSYYHEQHSTLKLILGDAVSRYDSEILMLNQEIQELNIQLLELKHGLGVAATATGLLSPLICEESLTLQAVWNKNGGRLFPKAP